jgi:glyoxylase-like metal-dependent hydrolase (beta-lactamase superfamily II)
VPDCNVTLLKKDGRTILFDAGAGGNFMPTAGKLVESLGVAGTEPASVTDVVFTHGHPDHLWGVLDDFNELIFPNASYHMGELVHTYWSNPDTVNSMPEERQSFAAGAATRLSALDGRVNLFKSGTEVLPGEEAMDTSGHTPGHMSFMLHGSTGKCCVTGDAISHAVLSFQRPDWPSGSDQDAAKGIDTRKQLLARLASENSLIVGYHLPNTGFGHVQKDGSAYRFVQV